MKKHTQLKRYVLVEDRIIDTETSQAYDDVEYYVSNAGNLFTKKSIRVVDDWYGDIGYVTHNEWHRNKVGKILYSSNNVETILNKFLTSYSDFICDIYYLDSSLINRHTNALKIDKKELKGAYKIRIYNEDTPEKTKYTFLNYENQYFKWEMYEGEN